jgi:hypothetical protein
MNAIARNLAVVSSHPIVARIATELRESRTARLGLIAAGAIVWVYFILVLSDARAPARERLANVEERVANARALERDQGWPAREMQATQQLAALRALLWKAPTRSLAEASFRDWIQQSCVAAGIKIRSLSVRAADAEVGAGASNSPTLPADVQRVRGRLVVDFDRQSWAMFLLKISISARIVNVDRLAVHTYSGQGAVAELDLEALFNVEAPGA